MARMRGDQERVCLFYRFVNLKNQTQHAISTYTTYTYSRAIFFSFFFCIFNELSVIEFNYYEYVVNLRSYRHRQPATWSTCFYWWINYFKKCYMWRAIFHPQYGVRLNACYILKIYVCFLIIWNSFVLNGNLIQ